MPNNLLFDFAAIAFMLASWVGYSRYSFYAASRRPSLMSAMQEQRIRWMRQMVMRENRITDATVVGNQLRGVTFFASTTVLIIAALVSLFAASGNVAELLSLVPKASPQSLALIDLKLATLLAAMIYAFFRFTWSLRQYKFLGVIVGAAPPHTADKATQEKCAQKAATLANAGSYAFNGGLRSYYFCLAMLTWFVHPIALVLSTTLVVAVLYYREFHSAAVLGLND